jgi:hypothetical protein
VRNLVDGFYSVFFTSREGYGTAMIAASNGKIAGADPTGVKIDGTYANVDNRYIAELKIAVPPGAQLVQGEMSGANGRTYDISFTFTERPDAPPFIRVETPYGPLNVKFVRLRGVDV